jgi:hypothetical protein
MELRALYTGSIDFIIAQERCPPREQSDIPATKPPPSEAPVRIYGGRYGARPYERTEPNMIAW